MDSQLTLNKQANRMMDMDMPQNMERTEQRNIEDFNNTASVLKRKDETEIARDRAIGLLKEELKMQSVFNVKLKNKELKESKESIEKINEKINKLKELQELENSYENFQNNYYGEGLTEVDREILTGYLNNTYGDVKAQIEEIKKSQENIKKEVDKEIVDIQVKITQYKESINTTIDERRNAVNDEFEKGDIVKSSKGKKRKGRKKGLELQGKVIGATEETAAMSYDMQHRKKKIDKWYKNPPVVNENDISLDGNEFNLVFKNKSGSSMNIKAVMEKIALLDIKIKSIPEDSEERIKYEERHKLLSRTLKVVCAANGIDSETGTVFEQNTEEQKLEVKKKVDFANAAYKETLENYRKTVALGDDLIVYDVQEEEYKTSANQQNMSRRERTNEVMKETKDLRADMAVFLGAVDKLKVGKEGVDDLLWGKAVRLCNSYKAENYDDIYTRREDLKKETKFYSDFANGNVAGILEFAGVRLKELEAKGINVQNAFNVEKIKENADDYEKFAVVVELINYARERSADKKDFDKFMAEDKAYDKFKNVATMSIISDYSEYIGKIKNFESLSEREKKVILYKSKKMSEQLKSAGLDFDLKLLNKELQDLEIKDMCQFKEEMDDEYRRAEMKPMYNESINELEEYVESLEASMKELELKVEKHEKIYKISGAVKEYITGKMLEDKCFVKVQALNEMKKIDRSSLRYKLEPQHNSKAQAIVDSVKEIMKLCENETKLIKEVEKVVNGLNVNSNNIDEYMGKIKEAFPKSDIAGFYEQYIKEKVKINTKLAESKVKHDKKYDKDKKSIVKDKEEEELRILRNAKLISFYNNPEYSEDAFEAYYKEYVNYEVKYNGKKEKDLEKKKEAFTNELKNKFYSLKDDPKAFEEEYKNMFSNYDEAIEKYNQFEEDSKENVEELEKTAKEKEKQAFQELISKVKESFEKHKELRVDKFVEYEKILYEVENTKDKKSEYVGLYKEDLLREITDEQMEIYVSERNATVFETYASIRNMTGEAYANYQREKMENASGVEDIDEYVDFEEIEKLREFFDSEETKDSVLKNKLIDNCLLKADANMKQYEKMRKTLESQKKTLEEAKQVLEKEKGDMSEKYTQEANIASYRERFDKTDVFFSNIIKERFIDRAINYARLYMKDDEVHSGHISKLSQRFIAYKDKVEALMLEKGCKTDQVNFLGITYNTVAIQDIMLNIDENKYKKYEESFAKKEDDQYKLYKSDFKAAETEGGYTTVDFEKLMYKRHKLMEWIDEHSSLETSQQEGMSIIAKIKAGFLNKDQQEYYERKETLEKLNKFLKLYCESNGVDFETGELLCEKKGMTAESIKEKVTASSTYLDETMTDIKTNYLDKNGDGDDGGSEEGGLLKLAGFFSEKFKALGDKIDTIASKTEKKVGRLNKKEESDPDVSLFAEVYSKELLNLESAAYVNEVKKRTAHTMTNVVTKIAECKASAKAGVAVGYKAADKEKERGKQLAGGFKMEAEASFSALSSEFLTKYSNKVLNMDVEAYAKGRIDVGHAKANAGLEMGLRNEKGEISPHLAMEAGLELALLKMEGSVGGKIMGAGIEAQLSFMAGLVAKANVKFNDWKLEIELDVALGIGAGVKLTLDFSDLKKKLFDMAKEKGGAIADTVCEKLCRWGFYSQHDMWYKIIQKDIDELFEEGVGLMKEEELKEVEQKK